MKAGFSRQDVTPEIGTIMAGHPGTKRAESIRDNLYVRASVISNGGNTLLFVSIDNLFVEDSTIECVCSCAQSLYGIPPQNVYVCATHTHSGPLTTGLFGQEKEGNYLDLLNEKVLKAVQIAHDNIQEVKMRFLTVQVDGLAFNARCLMKSGKIETHPFRYRNDIVAPEGGVDNTVAMISFYSSENNFLGALLNYANHPQVMERENTAISADFPGAIEKDICEKIGNGVVLFLNGACGDICPVNALSSKNYEVGEKWLEHMGETISQRIVSARATNFVDEKTIKSSAARVRLQIRELSEEKVLRCKEFLSKHNEEDNLSVSNYGVEEEGTDKLSLEEYIHSDAWLVQEYTDFLKLKEIRDRNAFEDVTLNVLRIGDIAMVTLPFEVFTEISVNIKKRSPFKRTLVVELANGCEGYLPNVRAFEREGGYETITMRSSKFAPESAKIIENAAIDLLNTLK